MSAVISFWVASVQAQAPTPTLGFVADSISINEQDSMANITLRLSAPADRRVGVWFATAAASAEPGVDYIGASGLVEFSEGEQSRSIAIEIVDDRVSEGAEFLTLRLFDPRNLVLRQSLMRIEIRDDDAEPLPVLTLRVGEVREGDGGANVEIELNPHTRQPVHVDVSTVAESAVNRLDYYGLYRSIQFQPGESLKRVWIEIVDDDLPEATEQLRVRLFNARGATLEKKSARLTIVDDDTVPPASQGNGDIAGLFYGNPLDGDVTGNSNQFRHSASRRFRAPRTGTVTAVNFNNRVLHQANIDERASGNNIWAQCKNGGLDKYTCGYILPNSYSLGNGGLIRVELRADDGSAAHHPSSTVLARTEEFVPMQLEDQKFPVFQFDRPVTLVAGEIYHLVHLQLNPPRCQRGQSVDQARNCDRDRGLVGFNGMAYVAGELANSPFGGQTEAILLRNASDETWRTDPDNLSWYGLRYDDGLWFGHMMAYYNSNLDAGTGGGNRFVGGDAYARQRFTVTDRNYRVDGVWLRLDRLSTTSESLTVTLKRSETTLASADISASTVPSRCDRACSGSWVYRKLSSDTELVQGQTYDLVLNAPAGSQYSVQSGFALDYEPFQMADEQTGAGWWRTARAEFSADGGRSWGPYATKNGRAYKDGRDLSVVFTLVGKPRHLR